VKARNQEQVLRTKRALKRWGRRQESESGIKGGERRSQKPFLKDLRKPGEQRRRSDKSLNRGNGGT